MNITTTPDNGRPAVAFVTHSAALSGAELFVARVTAAARRIRPLVVLGEHGPLETELQRLRVPVCVVPIAGTVAAHSAASRISPVTALRRGAGALSASRRLARVLRANRVDVLTTHSAKAHVYGGMAGRLAGIPVVTHLHALVDHPDASRRNAVLIHLSINAFASRVIANSQTTLASARIATRLRTSVIGCPVVVHDHVPEPDGDPVIVHIGRLAALKGQDIAIRAFAKARTDGIDPATRLRIVGEVAFPADAGYAAGLRALVDSLDLADVVDFVGWQSDPHREYTRSAIVLANSTRPEGFGQVVVEAMAAGRVVIATDCGGPAEVVQHGVDGLLVPPGEVDVLATTIRNVLSDRSERERLGASSRRAARRFEEGVIIPQLEEELLRAVKD